MSDLFNSVKDGKELRDDAIERVKQNCSPEWMASATKAVELCAKFRNEFTVDDVQEVLESLGVPKPREGRAMGAVMNSCRRSGLIEPTGRYKASRQAHCHANPRQIWRMKRTA